MPCSRGVPKIKLIVENKEPRREMRKEDREQTRLQDLLHHLEQLLPDSAQRQAFRRCSLTPPPSSLRLNPLMPPAANLLPGLLEGGRQAPWCKHAFDLPGPLVSPGHTLEYALGAFYIQAKAATLAVTALDPRPGERILDLAASPGGKATQIAAGMENSGLLIANEPQGKRIPGLVGNLERCGVANAIVTKAPGTLLARYFHNFFDRILLDAPCSGDGIVRKDLGMLRYWSVADSRRQAQQQTGLLRAAFHMLRPGGTMVYSTCSLSLQENEDVLLGLIKKFPDITEVLKVEGIDLVPLPSEFAMRYPATLAGCARVWPHLHDTEGAFVARIRKLGETAWTRCDADNGSWIPASESDPEADRARRHLRAHWIFEPPCPPGQHLAMDGRHLCLQPRETAAFKRHFPFYVRGGMRIARSHKDHYYLSQQAVTMWGGEMQGPSLELTWPQVQTLFRGESLELEQGSPFKGEVLCRHGCWTLCRGLVQIGGPTLLKAMLPRQLLRPQLAKLQM